jgi:hypothetical protein
MGNSAKYVPNRTNPVIVQLRDNAEYKAPFLPAVGSLTVADVPHEGDTVVISDGVTARTYTFTATVAAARDVLIGTTAATATALSVAINVDSPSTGPTAGPAIIDVARGIVAENPSAGVVMLQNTKRGSLGNVTITQAGAGSHLTIVGMAYGTDGYPLSAVLDAAADATTAVIAGVAGKAIQVLGWYAGGSVALGSYIFKSNATAKTGTCPIGIAGGQVVPFPFLCAVGETLNIVTVGAAVDGIVSYILG